MKTRPDVLTPPVLTLEEQLPIFDYFEQGLGAPADPERPETIVFTDPRQDRLSANDKRKMARVGVFCLAVGGVGVSLGLGAAYAAGQLAGDTVENMAQPTRYEAPDESCSPG